MFVSYRLDILVAFSIIAGSNGVSTFDFIFRVSDLYSEITDADLDRTVEEIQMLYPNSGYRIIHGHLQSRGLRVQSKYKKRPKCKKNKVLIFYCTYVAFVI